MIVIDCPECHAQFRVPAAAIPPEGRTLRCSSCAHTWYYIDPLRALLQLAEQPVETTPDAPSFLQHPTSDQSFADVMQQTSGHKFAKAKSSTPVVTKAKGVFWHLDSAGIKGYLAAAGVLALCAWGLAVSQESVTMILPRAQAAYDIFGMPLVLRASDLAFEETTLVYKDGKLSIKGGIHNLDSLQKAIPPVRIALLGDMRPEPLTVWVFRPDAPYIDPDQTIPFDVTRTFDQGAQVTHVSMTFMDETAATTTE